MTHKYFSLIAIAALLLVAGIALVLSTGGWQHAQAQEAPADSVRAADAALSIQSTRRISIPYGFETPLPIVVDGRGVIASGHGACTSGEQVSIAVTVTQSASAAQATGETGQTCTGELQTWSLTVMADTAGSFAAGPAQACGLATTRQGGYVTDTFDWCRDVDLISLDYQVYLPLVLGPSTP